MPALPRLYHAALAFIVGLLALLPSTPPARAANMLADTELSGNAYRSFELIAPVPDFCRKVCEKDTGCQAWMFSWPGKKGKRAKCFLFAGVQGKRKDTCCISGYRGKGSTFGETIARWFGSEKDTKENAGGEPAQSRTPPERKTERPAPRTAQAPRPARPTPTEPPLADPAEVERQRQFCAQYADAAVRANRKARELGCGFRGGLWGASRNGYFNWCMRNNEQRAERNTQRRLAALQECERRLATRPPVPAAPPAPGVAPMPPDPGHPDARPAPPAVRYIWRQARYTYSWLKRSGPGPRTTPWRPTLSGKCVLVRACECPQGNTCRVYEPGSIAVSWPNGCDGPPAYYVCRVRRR